MPKLEEVMNRLWTAPALSPIGLAVRSIALVIVYIFLRLAGLAVQTSIVSGTPLRAGGSQFVQTALGLTFIILHLFTLFVAPVVVITALLYGIFRQCAQYTLDQIEEDRKMGRL